MIMKRGQMVLDILNRLQTTYAMTKELTRLLQVIEKFIKFFNGKMNSQMTDF
jgi:hypothetical protein